MDDEALPLDEAARSLASIVQISNLVAHPNAHSLDLAIVKGWQCVVAKGEFQVGDKVVFLEVDSVLRPNTPWASMLERSKWRVRTIRLRGELSQGLCVGLHVLNQPLPAAEGEAGKPLEEWDLDALPVGLDVTERLGVTKYDDWSLEGAGLRQVMAGRLPTHLGFSKTDETRIQSFPEKLEQLAGQPWYATLKMDGSSMTCFWDPLTSDFTVCSRNMVCVRAFPVPLKAVTAPRGAAKMDRRASHAAREQHAGETADAAADAAADGTADAAAGVASEAAPDELAPRFTDETDNKRVIDDPGVVSEAYVNEVGVFWKMVYQYRLATKLAKYGRRYVIQGELFGAGVIKNRHQLKGHQVAVFNVFDLQTRRYLRYDQMVKVLSPDMLDLPMVKVVAEGDAFDKTLPQLLEMAAGNFEGTKHPREGIVVRSKGPPALHLGGDHRWVSFKVLNNAYLEKVEK